MPSPTRPRMIQSMIGSPGDRHQWLRHVSGQVAEPGALAARHDHRGVGQGRGADDVGEGVHAAHPAGGVDLRDGRDAPGVSSGRARAPGACRRRRCAGWRWRVRSPVPSAGRPAISARRTSPSVSTPCSRLSPSTRQQMRQGAAIDDRERLEQGRGRRLASGRRSSRSAMRPGSRGAESSASVIGEDPAPSGCARSGATRSSGRHHTVGSDESRSRIQGTPVSLRGGS